MESLNPTVVYSGSSGVIIDASGNKWTISPTLSVFLNGKEAGNNYNIMLMAYVDKVMWCENVSNQWYRWVGTGWVEGNNPLPPPGIRAILNAINALAQQLTTSTYAIEKAVDSIPVLSNTAVLSAISLLQADLDAFKATVIADFAANAVLLNKIINMLLPRITAANPTFTKQEPPVKSGP
jgi:hypothetical protein